jgi:hypothetical protein
VCTANSGTASQYWATQIHVSMWFLVLKIENTADAETTMKRNSPHYRPWHEVKYLCDAELIFERVIGFDTMRYVFFFLRR